MIQSLFYKEWIKSRWLLLIILVALVAVVGYTFMVIAQEMRVGGYNKVWENSVQYGITYFAYLKYVPLLAGIGLAVSQYAPEMANKRLKLTLHLPMGEQKILFTMLGYGLLSLFAMFLLTYISVCVGMNIYFTSEIADWNLALIQPWLWGGLVSYLLTTWVCLEPVWRQRIINGVLALLLVSIYYTEAMPKAFYPLLPILIVLVVLCVAFPYHSLVRFKDGEQ